MARKRFKPPQKLPYVSREPLTTTEAARLEELKAVVFRGSRIFIEVGTALAEIRDLRLYRGTHATFEEYCQEVFGWNRDRAYKLIESAEVAKQLEETQPEQNVSHGIQTQPKLTNERQARELSKVPQDKRREVVQKAAEKTGGKVTAKAIKDAAKTYRPPPVPPPPKPSDPLKPHIRAAFDSPDFEEIMSLIRQAGEKLELLADSPLGYAIAKDGKGQSLVGHDLRNAWSSISSCRPYAECIYCYQRCDNCSACKEQGWLPRKIFEMAPAENQKRSKVITK